MNKKPTILNKARAKFIELYTRLIPIDESKDGSVYWNGENNLYPNEIQRVILNSPTASRASKVMAKFISGKGVVGTNPIINPEKNYRESDIVKIASHDLSQQGGVFFHVSYFLNDNLELQPSLDVLDYCRVRKQKEDDSQKDTKFILKDFSIVKNQFGKTQKETWFYPFTKSKTALLAQIKADYLEENKEETEDLATMLPFFRGQVYYLNLTTQFKYALSPFDSVFNDMDSEFRISMYINRQFRGGFLGKTYVITAGLDDEDDKKVQEDITTWLGSENIGGTYHLSLEAGADIEKVFKVGQVKSELDEKMFEKTILNIRDNILGCANNIPLQLVKSDNTLFGQSADVYVEQKKFFTEQTEEERSSLEQAMTYLGFPCKIIPIVEIEEKQDEGVEPSTKIDPETKTAINEPTTATV